MKTLKRKIWGSFRHSRRRRGKDIEKAKNKDGKGGDKRNGYRQRGKH